MILQYTVGLLMQAY